MTKEQARVQWQGRLKSLGPVDQLISQKICAAIAASPEFQKARRIALHCARSNEPDLTELWQLRPHESYFPVTNFKTLELHFYRVDDLSELNLGYSGIQEPPPRPEYGAGRWETQDLILVPGLVFELWGGRLGSGKGYYDRFLCDEAKGAIKWGVCRLAQISNEKLDQERTDVRMGAVVTEAGIKKTVV